MKGIRNLWAWALLTPPLAVAIVLFVVPLLYLFYISLHAASTSEIYGSALTLENYTAVLSDSFYLGIIRRTLGTATAILGLCLLIGYPVAYFVALLPTRRRMVVMLLLLFPLVVSNVVRAYGWVALLGRRGVINTGLRELGVIDVPLDLLYNVEAVVVGLMTILLPYMVITIANSLTALDRRYEEAAQALGAGPVRTFLHVTLPLSTPGVASGMLLVFLLTLSAYVTITLLGGPRSKLLVSMVYDSVIGFQWPRAAALAFILLALALALTGVILAVLRPNRIQGIGEMSPALSVGRAIRGGAAAVAFLLILAPIVIVVVTAFSPTDYFQFPPPGLSLRWFVVFFRLDNMRSAFTLSLELALLSATLATVLGTLGALYLARRRGVVASLLQALFLAPLVFPTIILGLALLLLYKTLGVPVFTGLLLAHCVIGMPYCFRTVLASVQALDPALEEAGQSLGAGPLATLFLVTLPLIWQGVVSGWLFAFIVSFGELNTALFLSGPGLTTLPIEIFSYLQFQGSQLVIAAASTIQIALIVLLVAGIERIVGMGRIIRSR